MSISLPESDFGPVRRIITSHHSTDTDGSSVAIHDDLVPLQPVLNGMAHITPLYASLGLPTSSPHCLQSPDITSAMAMAPNVVMQGGVNCRITDVKPNFLINMHRTSSVDYNIMLKGSATLITPARKRDGDGKEGSGGEETRTVVREGEVVVQLGTLHAWESGPEGARWITVVVPAKPVEKDGNVFGDMEFQ